MHQVFSRILRNEFICDGYYELEFEWDSDRNGVPLPGQFVTIRVGETTAPLLRRPFAFSAWYPHTRRARVIYQVRGPATRILSALNPGDTLDVIGPLGHSFPEPDRKGLCVLVAGGIGLGPILFWAHHLRQRGRKCLVVYGCAEKALVPRSESFRKARAVVCTDDGSAGFHGTSVDYLRSLEPERWIEATLFACGPWGMLKACHELGQERAIPCWVSMEQTMACGVGACMGCVVRVKTGNGFARVCTEGPVFESSVVDWE